MLVEKTFVPEFSSDRIDCYLVKLQVYRKGQFVYGYLTLPKEPGKYPVVFSPPGAGIKPMTPEKDLFYAEGGFIRFDMGNRAGGYPHLFTKFSGMDTPEKLKTLEYYDVVNFARLIKVPVFMTWGYNDNTCPPTTSYIVYNVPDCKKETLITPVTEHWISMDKRYYIMEWIKKNLYF